jgi:hypothetical protein
MSIALSSPVELVSWTHYTHSESTSGNFTGQFRPGLEARPNIGTPGVLEFAQEDRVEVVVNDEGQREEIKRAVQELKVVRSIFLVIMKFSDCF